MKPSPGEDSSVPDPSSFIRQLSELPEPSDERPIRIQIGADEGFRDALSGCLFDAGAQGLQEERGRLVTYCCDGELLAALALAIQEFELNLKNQGEDALEIELDAPENTWDAAWLNALEPAQITPTWVLRPTHQSSAPEGENTLWFQPEVSFGAGGHDTTQLAASRIEEFCATHSPSEMLDVGTGTGVLAMVAKKCGVSDLLCLDIDECAVESARANFELNGLGPGLHVETGSADSAPRPYQFVVANINTHILLEIAGALAVATAAGGTLILTGLLREDIESIAHAFEARSFVVKETKHQGEWSLLLLEKSAG